MLFLRVIAMASTAHQPESPKPTCMYDLTSAAEKMRELSLMTSSKSVSQYSNTCIGNAKSSFLNWRDVSFQGQNPLLFMAAYQGRLGGL